MAADLVIHGFETSNNFKVRIALGYKQIPFEFRPIDPGERDTLVAISGQYLTPVMVHGETVLFDSAAILRYLDANFPGTPKLFGMGHAQQWEIENWERFGRGELAAGLMALVHHRVTTGTAPDASLQASAADRFAAAVDEIEEALAGRDWLVGESMSAADVTCAAVFHRVRVSAALPLPEGLARVPEWADRVVAFDPGVGR